VPTTGEDKWHFYSPYAVGYSLALDPASPRKSHPTVRLTGSPQGSARGPWGAFRIVLRDLDAYRGRRMRMTVYLRSDGVAQRGGLSLASGVRTTVLASNSNLSVRGTLPWLRYTATVDVPAAATFVESAVVLQGPGTIWIDEVTFTPVDPPARPMSHTAKNKVE
jgi:hypothetical protein